MRRVITGLAHHRGNREKEKRRVEMLEKHCLRSARSHLLVLGCPQYAIQMCGLGGLGGDRDVALPGTRVSRLHGPGAVEMVTDSGWGCSPIRGRLLEDDDNGWLKGAWEDHGQRQACDAHSCLTGSVSTCLGAALIHRNVASIHRPAFFSRQSLPLSFSLPPPFSSSSLTHTGFHSYELISLTAAVFTV